MVQSSTNAGLLKVKLEVLDAFFFCLRKGSHDHRNFGNRLLCEIAEFQLYPACVAIYKIAHRPGIEPSLLRLVSECFIHCATSQECKMQREFSVCESWLKEYLRVGAYIHGDCLIISIFHIKGVNLLLEIIKDINKQSKYIRKEEK